MMTEYRKQRKSRGDINENILRSLLIVDDVSYSGKNLYQDFLQTEEQAHDTWVSALAHDRGSHSGATHLKNVEALICGMLEKLPEIRLSLWEAYILLSAILFHDVGRALSDAQKTDLDVYAEKNPVGIMHEHITSDDHAYYSYLFIKMKYQELGLRLDLGIVNCIAYVCGAHEISLAKELEDAGCPDEIFLDRFGRIRIGWLGCLLSLGDELDNSYHRAMPAWVRYMPSEAELNETINKCSSTRIDGECSVRELMKEQSPGTKGLFRGQIYGCELNLEGRLLIVYPPEDVKTEVFDDQYEGKCKELKIRIQADMKKKMELLHFWSRQLRQLHMELYTVAVSVEGQLYGYKDRKHHNDKKSDQKEEFGLVVEPVMRTMKMMRVIDAAVQLRFNSFGKSTFPWETLATEAGIARIQETKLIFHRLAMLSSRFNKARITQIIFTELDGEWTLQIVGHKNSDESSIAIQEFYKFALDIIDPGQPEAQYGQRSLEIKNKNLAYLFDEYSKYKRIYFPSSDSILFSNNKPPVGINLVISGPAGVGKSTLAMELIAQGWIEECKNTKPVCAYYSLEQPLESIRQLAMEMDLKEDGIISFHPNPIEQERGSHETRYVHLYKEIIQDVSRNSNIDRILLLPRLAPHSYRETPDEEQLFWFRYKQVARIIEAHRSCPSIEGFSLSIIVLDNLNAFSHDPLARQRVHQLFRLIAWGGILGVHVVEQNPAEKFGVFQAEVEALSDIVVHLDWNTHDYRYKTIEVIKSRCQRNVLGPHPFKIRRKTEGGVLEENPKKVSRGFTVFPSLHTQVVRIEMDQEDKIERSTENALIGRNMSLRKLVHKNSFKSGIANDAFVTLSGRSGGHKLALGLDYVHGKEEGTLGLVLNMGQPIFYDAVAGCNGWWDGNKPFSKRDEPWPNQKVVGDFYCANKCDSFMNPEKGAIIVLNFQPGFLLPEEFIDILLTYFDIVKRKQIKIDRVLFNSTAHLASRFPLLDKDPLILTALVRILKKQGIGMMVIAVEDAGNQERVESLTAMADVKLNIHHLGDKRVPPLIMEKLVESISKNNHSARLISSDNVTGKDYTKSYGLLNIVMKKDQPELEIINLTGEKDVVLG